MNIAGRNSALYNESLALEYLNEQYRKLIKVLSTKFAKENIGVINIRFGKLYFEIAIIIFRLYRAEFSTEQFNRYWNDKLNLDERLTTHQVVNVQIDEMMLTSVSEFSDNPFLALCDNVDMINNSGAINIGWNNGVKINDEFIEKYLRRYFEKEILPDFKKALNKFNNSSKNRTKAFEYKVFGVDNSGCLNKEFWTLSFFTDISPQLMLRYFQKFSSEHDMWAKSNEVEATINQNSLEFSFGKN